MRGLTTIQKMTTPAPVLSAARPTNKTCYFSAMDAMLHITHTASVSTEFHGDTGFVWNVRKMGHMQELPSLSKDPVADNPYQDERNPEPKQVYGGLANG
jgi:hypothetical protein